MIELTPAMIAAGSEVLVQADVANDYFAEVLAELIFRAMAEQAGIHVTQTLESNRVPSDERTET